MLLVVILLFIMSQAAVIIFKAFKKSKFLLTAEIGMVMILSTIYINGAKNGGFLPEQFDLIFGAPLIADFAKNLVISPENIAIHYIIARLSVCLSVLYDAIINSVEIKRFFSKYKYMYLVVALPVVAAGFLSGPTLFTKLFANKFSVQNAIVASVDCLILLYSATALAINIFEHFRIMLSWYRKRDIYRMLCVSILLVQYIFLCTFNPITIFQDYHTVFISLSYIKYLNVYSLVRLLPILSLSILMMVVSIVGFYFYARYDYDRENREIRIKKEMDAATLATSGMVHGLKNQLISAKILSGDIENSVRNGDSDKAIALAGEFSELNAHMLERINTLYKSFKNINSVLVATEVDEIISSVLKKVRTEVPRECIEIEKTANFAMADAELLSEAISNLVINAYESVPKDKTPHIKITAYMTRNHLVFSVSDNGKGIPKELRKNLFSPFITTKNTASNWGLGLCYARQIVKNHLGDINFETTVGEGTTFFVVLPKYDLKEM